MKVKIIKCTDELHWYKKHIGEIYDVRNYKSMFMYEIENFIGGRRFILVDDCITLDELRKQKLDSL